MAQPYDLNALGAALTGLPPVGPDSYIGQQGGPMMRLGMDNPGSGLTPNMGGLGQLGWQMFINPQSPYSMATRLFGASKMASGPGAGSATSYYASLRQQAAMQQLRAASQKADIERTMPMMRRLAQAQGYKGANMDAMAADMASQYVGQAGTLGAFMPGMEDWLVPGGTTSSFSTKMYVAGMRARPVPGKFGLGVDDVLKISQSLESKFMGSNGLENRGFTRGFSMGDFGQTAIELAQRDLLPTSGAMDKGKADKIVRQIKGYVNAMDAMKGLIGRPDAPINELMQSIDSMFGGNAGAVPVEQLSKQITQVQSMSRMSGIPAETMIGLYRNAGISAKGYGLNSTFGSMMMTPALMNVEAGAGASTAPSGKNFNFHMQSKEQQISESLGVAMQASTAPMWNKLGVLLQGSDRYSYGGEAGELVKKFKSGQAPTARDIDTLMKLSENGGLEKAYLNAGGRGSNWRDALSDKIGLQETSAKFGLHKYGQQGATQEAIKNATRSLVGSDQIRDYGTAGFKTSAEIKGAYEAMASAERNTPEGRAAALMEHAAKRGKKLSASGASELERILIRGLDKNNDTGKESRALLAEMNPAAQAAVQAKAGFESALEMSFKEAGIGTGTGGGAQLVSNLVRAMAEGGDKSLQQLTEETFGGVDSTAFKKVLGNPEVAKQLTEMNKMQQEIKKLSGNNDPKSVAKRKELEARRTAGLEVIKDLADVIDPERAAVVSDREMQGRVFGASSKADQLKMIAGDRSDEAIKAEQAMLAKNFKGDNKIQGEYNKYLKTISNPKASDEEMIKAKEEYTKALKYSAEELDRQAVGIAETRVAEKARAKTPWYSKAFDFAEGAANMTLTGRAMVRGGRYASQAGEYVGKNVRAAGEYVYDNSKAIAGQVYDFGDKAMATASPMLREAVKMATYFGKKKGEKYGRKAGDYIHKKWEQFKNIDSDDVIKVASEMFPSIAGKLSDAQKWWRKPGMYAHTKGAVTGTLGEVGKTVKGAASWLADTAIGGYASERIFGDANHISDWLAGKPGKKAAAPAKTQSELHDEIVANQDIVRNVSKDAPSSTAGEAGNPKTKRHGRRRVEMDAKNRSGRDSLKFVGEVVITENDR